MHKIVVVIAEIFNTAVKETALVYIVNYLFVVARCSLQPNSLQAGPSVLAFCIVETVL